MATTFRFTTQQLAELDLLRTESRVGGSYFTAYQYILDILDPSGLGPKPRDNAVRRNSVAYYAA